MKRRRVPTFSFAGATQAAKGQGCQVARFSCDITTCALVTCVVLATCAGSPDLCRIFRRGSVPRNKGLVKLKLLIPGDVDIRPGLAVESALNLSHRDSVQRSGPGEERKMLSCTSTRFRPAWLVARIASYSMYSAPPRKLSSVYQQSKNPSA